MGAVGLQRVVRVWSRPCCVGGGAVASGAKIQAMVPVFEGAAGRKQEKIKCAGRIKKEGSQKKTLFLFRRAKKRGQRGGENLQEKL